MDKKAASALIRDTLESPFDKERFTAFAKNLLNTIDQDKAFTLSGQYIPEKFRDFVKSYERIGTYTDPEGMKIDVLIVNMKNESTLARARTAQRNFVANYLKERDEKDAGLIAFVSPNPEDWRFSFVKMDYQLVEEKGKVKAKEDLTPARRYSFLVGTQESSHTAQQQLLPILADDTHNPMLAMIEKAFSIESVTKEFFEKYRELFLRVKEALEALIEKDKTIRTDFEQKGVNTADFCKKLLGQIVFLYFLQKKGWFGVERDAEWGSGPKNFLRQLFKGELTTYKNFFNEVLEPLFYDSLARDRSDDDHYYPALNCKIPFLNGGLFDPMNGYDWWKTDICLPNELFSNAQKTKEGDTGTGILDMFDRYNFTVKEDEPLEKEVAVDPEMLGKVFENLLEVKDRKSKGTYYTPREIVHYMCQESLINYLSTELGEAVPREDISLFIQIGETVAEHESRVVSKGKETSSYTHKLPESIRKNAAEIDRKLQNIRVCDPAIGSGAFPVGMMNEIVRARQTLTSYLGGNGDRNPYDFKRHAIQECLYGVDIDPGAVEIAKLRLWLSLVVDEDDIGDIKPLPNLDYRIMQGNSLLEEYEGIKLFDEKLLGKDADGLASELDYVKQNMKKLEQEMVSLHNQGKLTDVRRVEIETEVRHLKKIEKQLLVKPEVEKMTGMFDAPSKAKGMYEQLKNLHQEFFEATHREKKKKIKEQIENLEWELIETSLREQGKTKTLDELKKLKTSNARPFFLWRLHFAEVFSEKKGFDVVIANPPYDVYEGHKTDEIPQLKNLPLYEIAKGGKLNAYKLFLARSVELQRRKGILCEIFQNSFLGDRSAVNVRKYFLGSQRIIRIDSFPERDDVNRRVFENVKMSVCIMTTINEKVDDYAFDLFIWHDRRMTTSKSVQLSRSEMSLFDSENYTIPSISNAELSVLRKIALCPKMKGISHCYQGEVNLTTHKQFLSKDSKGRIPLLKGAAIQKWCFVQKMKQGEFEYVDAEAFLNDNAGERSQHHKTQRVVMQGITGVDERFRLKTTLLDEGTFCAHSVNYIIIQNRSVDQFFVIGLLNSELLNWYFKVFNTNSNVNGYEVHNLPICGSSNKQKEEIIRIVRSIYSLTQNSDRYLTTEVERKKVYDLEKKLNAIVYEMYGLTEQEVGILEESIS